MTIDYLHEIPGRVRIRCRGLRRQIDKIAAAKAQLKSTAGVTAVTVNLVTGSFTILYDPATTTSAALVETFKAFGDAPPVGEPEGPQYRAPYFPMATGRGRAISPQAAPIARAVAGLVVQQAIERSLLAIVAAVL